MQFPGKHTPRWIIFITDILISSVSYLIAFLLRFEFHPPALEIVLGLNFLAIFVIVRSSSFLIGKTYAGIIRFTSTQDSLRIFTVVTLGSVLFILLNQVKFHFVDQLYFIPNSIIIIEYLTTLFALIVSRIAVKLLYIELNTSASAKTRIAIYGAGESGMITKRTMDRRNNNDMRIVAFIDDNKSKVGKKIEGINIHHSDQADHLFSSGKVDQLIISIQKLSSEAKQKMINKAFHHDIRIMNVPPVQQWIKGELTVKQIRDIGVEDLLGRPVIKLENKKVKNEIQGKSILVTGAAGSIGSEIARQIIAYNPQKLILFDQAETPSYELERELGHLQQVEFVIGDVRNKERVRRLFDHANPQIIFHAAAYKHVPLMESNPSESIYTNVLGSKVIADLADEYKAEKLVQISTDKAVNPTNVMGASKRVAEMYAQAKNQTSDCAFITTRFGNVLGSNGSVIPLFKKQIKKGGPVTVTDKNVTRFFMTIPEAVQLVLEAEVMGLGGEIFVFDMGKSIKIYDLAKQMIKLSGFELGKDIEIKFTGLRPGEKLYEELMTHDESTLSTQHNKIKKATVMARPFENMSEDVDALIKLFDTQDNQKIVMKLKEIVPEYVSANSDFSELDNIHS